MPTELDRLLDSIDPARTFDSVSADMDRAVNSFAMDHGTIEDWDEYERFLAGFLRHLETVVLRMRAEAPDNREFYWTRCTNILKKEFGPSGHKTAFEMVKTGKEGGLYRILKAIAEKMTKTYAQNEIAARVNHYLSRLRVDEQLAAAEEYLGKYGHLLPAEFTCGNAARLKVHFQEILKEHPKTIRRIRRIGR